MTLEEVFTAIDRRIQLRLAASGHAVYQSLAEQIDRLRKQAIKKAGDSVEFLKRALEVARTAVQAESSKITVPWTRPRNACSTRT